MKFRLLCILFALIPSLPYLMPNQFTQNVSRILYLLWFLTCLFLLVVFISLGTESIFLALRKSAPKERLKKNQKTIKQIILLLLLSTIAWFNGANLLEYWQMRKLEKVVDARLKFKEKNNQWPKSLEEISFTENKIKAPFYAVKSASTFLDNETCPVRFKYIGDPLFNDLDCDLVFCETIPKGPPYKKVRTGNHGYSWYKFCYY